MIEPLLSLVEKFELETRTAGFPNEVQTSPWEYGHSAAIIALAAMIFESALNRAAHLRKESVGKDRIAYFGSLVNDPWLSAAVAELFVVRDVIAHNHVWEGLVVNDDSGLRYTNGPVLSAGYGDKKYRALVDRTSRQTKKLGLNVVPTRMWRQDVLNVLVALDKALSALEQINPGYFDVTTPAFKFHGEYVSFRDAVSRMKATKLTKAG